MRIVVLHPAAESDSPFASYSPPYEPALYAPEHDWSSRTIRKALAHRQVAELARDEPDVVVNLCDGAEDEDRPGIEVVRALERFGLAYTGATEHVYDPSRLAMKMACQSVGVSFPAFATAQSRDDAPAIAHGLSFPMLVKHPRSYSSVGLTEASRVSSVDELAERLGAMCAQYGGALVEEFIAGREFTVLVAEGLREGDPPRTWPTAEFELGGPLAFKHFELKWKSYESMVTRLVADASLDERLRADAAGCFEALGATGYGRCDFRMGEDGVPKLLELNPNCAVFYPPGQHGSADLILARSPGGHRAFLEHILAVALRRRKSRRRSWRIGYTPSLGFGLFTTRALRAGDRLVRYEGSAFHLVSRGHLEREWSGRRRELMARYGWPVAPDLLATWSPDPEEWRPINHSCEPNSWFDGLDIVARFDLAEGDEITVDYATFCGRDMQPFPCECGSALCRKLVTGADLDEPLLAARYAGHIFSGAWRGAGRSSTEAAE